MHKPLLSIVIANYNYGRFMGEALDSIAAQCDAPVIDQNGCSVLPIKGGRGSIEVIVCDAGSTDESLEVIRSHANLISWWCSERDKGQSDAFNKGFSRARGEFITWLNSDEIYTRGTFKILEDYIHKNPKADWITSNDYAFLDKDSTIKYICWGPHHQPHFLGAERQAAIAFGPSSFMRRTMFEKVGPFDVDVHYGMDTTYWHRLTKAGYRQSRINRFSWGFRVHDESKTAGVQTEKIVKRRQWEESYVAEKYGKPFVYKWSNPWYAFWMFCRLLDGSLLLNAAFRFLLKGKDARTVWNGRLWK